ncbi:MAG: thioredoxin [Methanomicrobiaceae archaeon]|nr:thioredoxin [Methanomicrobiaceae archaeon]
MEQNRPQDDELRRLREKRLRELQRAAAPSEPAKVLEVSDSTFNGIIQSYPFIVVDFWAEWCGPCRMVGPAIEELAQEYAGRVTFGKCNVDENLRVATSFGISAIPTLLLFSHGRMVDRVVGAHPKSTIKARILRVFGAAVQGGT